MLVWARAIADLVLGSDRPVSLPQLRHGPRRRGERVQEVGRPHNVPHVGRAQRGLLLVPLQPPVPAQVFKVRASSRCLGRSRLGPPSPVGAVPRLRGTGCSPPYCVARFLRGLGTRAICGPGVGVPHCKGDAKSMLPYFQNTCMLAGNGREVAT